MRAAVAGALVLATAPAHADTLHDVLDIARASVQVWNQTQESRTSQRVLAALDHAEDAIELATALLESNPIRGGAVDVAITAGGGLDVDRGGAEAAAVLSAHLDGDQCAVVGGEAIVRGRTATSVDDRARASAEGSIGACLPEGLIWPETDGQLAVFPIRGVGVAALNKTPALTAARALVPEPYSELGWAVWTEGMRYLREHGTYYYAGPGVTLEQRYQWPGFPTGESARQEWIGDAYFVRLAHRRRSNALADRAIDIFGFGYHAMIEGDNDVGIIQFWPLRISGLGFGTDAVLADAVVGVSAVGKITDNNTGEVVDNENIPDRAIAFVHAALSVGSQPAAAGASYDRGLDTNYLLELVQEDRGSLWMRQQHGVLRYTAALFGERALHFPDRTTKGTEWLAGASFEGTYRVGDGVAVGLSLEATHSFQRDAVLDGRVAPDGVRAFANISYTRRLAESAP